VPNHQANRINIGSNDITTALCNPSRLQYIFARLGHPTKLRAVTADFVDYFRLAEIKLHEHRPLQDFTTAALINVTRNAIPQCPYPMLQNYLADIINAMGQCIGNSAHSEPTADKPPICLNELEVITFVSALKLIMIMSQLTTNTSNTIIERFISDQYNPIVYKLTYNVLLTSQLLCGTYQAFFLYWSDNCKNKKKTEEFLNKCGFIFTLKPNPFSNPSYELQRGWGDVIIPDIEKVGEDVGMISEAGEFYRNFELSQNFRGFTHSVLRNIISYAAQLHQEKNFFSKTMKRVQYRMHFIEKILESTGLKIGTERSTHDQYTITPLLDDHQNFIDRYRIPNSKTNYDEEQWQRLLRRIPNEPTAPDLCFNLISEEFSQQLNHAFAIASCLTVAPRLHVRYKIPAAQRTPPPAQPAQPAPVPIILGHDPQYNAERSQQIKLIANTQDEDLLLSIRVLWFGSESFQEHPWCLSKRKWWTITPDGLCVRISKRNSDLNLLLAIKLCYLWSNSFDFTPESINTKIINNKNLWFIKVARSTIIGTPMPHNRHTKMCVLKNMPTSALYKQYVLFLSNKISKPKITEYLQSRWTQTIKEMIRKQCLFTGSNTSAGSIAYLPISGGNTNPLTGSQAPRTGSHT